MNGYVCVSAKHYLQNQAVNPMAVVCQPVAIEVFLKLCEGPFFLMSNPLNKTFVNTTKMKSLKAKFKKQAYKV